MRILFIGQLNEGQTSLQRMRNLISLGHVVQGINYYPDSIFKIDKNLLYRTYKKIFGPLDLAKTNQRIIKKISEETFDIIWIEKGLTILPNTLKKIKEPSKGIIVGYSPDYMGARHNQTRHFIKGVAFYDYYFTTKSYGVAELENYGCRKVFFIGNGYDPGTHHPIDINEDEKSILGGKVGFIGDYEKERANYIYYLAENGIPVRIWGPNWFRKFKSSHPMIKIENRPLNGLEYSKAICSFDINLAFLRKINKDLQTQRSVEIPACRGFMLAERTNEHLALFNEGKEADFFSTKEELLEKINFYLNHSVLRNEIAKEGFQRCINGGYSNIDRLKEILNTLEKNKAN
ncbi:MAG: CgeB family protein [Ignavibacteriaceae bacterium]